MKDFDYYRKCEESDKGDSLEYCYGVEKNTTGTILKNNTKINMWDISYFRPDERFSYLFCMSCCTEQELKKQTFEFVRMGLNFGKYVVIINDVKSFMQKLNIGFENNKNINSVVTERVSYKDYGLMGPFCKRTKFAYQNEWRIVIEPKEKINAFFEFSIGDLRDISEQSMLITDDKDLQMYKTT